MKDPEKYLPELNTKIKKQFGNPIEVYLDSSKINKIDLYIYIFKYKDNYFRLDVTTSAFNTPSITIEIYDNFNKFKEELTMKLNRYFYEENIFTSIQNYPPPKL